MNMVLYTIYARTIMCPVHGNTWSKCVGNLCRDTSQWPNKSSSGEYFNDGSMWLWRCSRVALRWSGQLLWRSLADIHLQLSSPKPGAHNLLSALSRILFEPSNILFSQGEFVVTTWSLVPMLSQKSLTLLQPKWLLPCTINVSGAIYLCKIHQRLSTVFLSATNFDLKPQSLHAKMSVYRPIFEKPPFPVEMER